MDICFSNRVKVADNVLIRDLEGESVLLNLDSERYFGLDDVASRMWAVLTTSNSIQDSYEILAGEFDVPKDKLRDDLEELVRELVEHGLVEIEAR